jgi:hypothetical protein
MAIQIPSATRAATVANNVARDVSNVATQINGYLTNGQAANPQQNIPGVAAADIILALGGAGSAGVLQLQLIVAVVNASDATLLAAALAAVTPAPTPTPTPAA